MIKINKILAVVTTLIVILFAGCGGGSSSESTTNLTSTGAFPYYWAKTLYGYQIEFTVTESTGAAVEPGFQVIYTFDAYGSVVGYNTKNYTYYYPDNYTSTVMTDSYDLNIILSYYGGSAVEDYMLTPMTATTGTYTYDAVNGSLTGSAKGTYRILVDGGGNTGYVEPDPLPNGTWASPVLMDSNATVNQTVTMADGAALSAWTKTEDNGTKTLMIDSYMSGTGWSGPSVVANETGYFKMSANDAGDTVQLIWYQNRKFYSKVYSAQQWGAAAEVATVSDALITLQEPTLVTNNSGDAMLFWAEYTLGSPNATYLYCAAYSNGSGWGVPSKIGTIPTASASGLYDGDIDENQNMLIVVGSVSYYYDQNTGIWTRTLIGGTASTHPRVIMDANGNAAVVWLESAYTKILSRRFTPGIGWSSEVEISDGSTVMFFEPDLAMDSLGNLIAVWSQQDDTGLENIYANRYTASSGTWGSAALIETDNTERALSPSVVFDGNDNAVVLWTSWQHIWANHYLADTGWQTPRIIGSTSGENPDDYVATPDIAKGQNGDVTASWFQQTDGIMDVYTVRFE